MQFRLQKNRLRLLAYRGYNKEKKRSNIKLVGTIDWNTLQIPAKVLEVLKEAEKAELQKYLDAENRKRRHASNLNAVQDLPNCLKSLLSALASFGDTLPAACDKNWAAQTWAQLREMEDHLRHLGLRKPHRPKS